MRNSLLFLLLASAAMPASAADEDGDRAARREARAEARAERQAERAQSVERSEPKIHVRSIEPRSEDRPVVHQQQTDVVHSRVLERPSQPALDAAPPRRMIEVHQGSTDSVRQWRGRERRLSTSPADIEQHNGTLDNGSFREMRREPTGRDGIGNRRGRVIGSLPQQGAQPPLPTSTRQSRTGQLSSGTAHRWRSHWRSDRRYDWRNHRHRHRSLFHLGFYYDPFGWGYRRYSIGSRLWPSYYRGSYWLNDPWQYRLPYAPPGYRWIRYHGDALLVDTWDGQVVDVIYNFFW